MDSLKANYLYILEKRRIKAFFCGTTGLKSRIPFTIKKTKKGFFLCLKS